jgi:uncharacterized CHY-type Zn-finger protein
MEVIMSRWTKKDVDFLKDNYSIHGSHYCSQQLNKTIEAVRNKANRLNLKRDGNSRYNRPKTPDGYTYCYKCKQILEDSKFYKKNKNGSYGKKTNMCRSCSQIKSMHHYRNNKSSAMKRRQQNPEKYMYQNVKSRAKQKGIEFTLELTDIVIPNRCPMLNIPIKPNSNSPNSPSIDRLDNTKGYTKDNILIISRKANTIKNNATSKELFQIAEFLKSRGL